MDERQHKHSFWTTVPGILTGTAAILTALTGLYLAVRSQAAVQSPEVTVKRSAVPATEWPLIGEETFSAPNPKWAKGRESPDQYTRRLESAVVAGKLRLDTEWKTGGERFLESPFGPATDFYIAVDVRFVLQEPLEGFAAGILFGRVGSTDYNFRINPQKQFALFKFDGASNAPVLVIAWTPANFDPLRETRIAVSVDRQQIHLHINSELVGVYRDPSFTGGKVGLLVVGSKPDSSVVVDFDNFEFRRKPPRI